MRQPSLVLVLVLLVAGAPLALAHGTEDHSADAPHPPPQGGAEQPHAIPDETPEARPLEGYTGPGREPYVSFVNGVWLYGHASATPIGRQIPVEMHGDGDWLVWEDAARADIFLYNIPAGTGFYLTNDSYRQTHPRISDGVVVWEDHRDYNRADIFAYFIETSETRRLSFGPGSHRSPSIHGDLVAWETEERRRQDISAASLLNMTEWTLSDSADRESDPLVLDGRVYWRTYRYNLWDVVGQDVATGKHIQLSSDPEIQGEPFTNGRDVLFLTQFYTGWELMRYDPREDRVTNTHLKMATTQRTPASGDGLLQVARDAGWSQLVARNLTGGTTLHVSGNLVLGGDTWLMGRTAFAPIRTANGTTLLSLDISPFAFGKQPSLNVISPAGVTAWVRPLVVEGVLSTGSGWTEPVTFTYRVGDEPPQLIPPGKTWRFTLDYDPEREPGPHVVVVRATFREGPPVEATVALYVPEARKDIDVERAGPAYHAARVLNEFNILVVDNPASWLLIPLVLVLVVLVLVRVWIWLWPKRRRYRAIEYVTPDEA